MIITARSKGMGGLGGGGGGGGGLSWTKIEQQIMVLTSVVTLYHVHNLAMKVTR